MIKQINILKNENVKTKTKTVNTCLNLKVKTKIINSKVNIICFNKKIQKKINNYSDIRQLDCSVNINTKEIQTSIITLFNTNIYGIEFEKIKRYGTFVQENFDLILSKISLLYKNFNEKHSCQIVPNEFAILRILLALETINAKTIKVFNNTKLEDFYPEIFKVEVINT